MSPEQRQAQLDKVRAEGREVCEVPMKRERRRTILAWLKIARLHFYAMTLLAYGLGVGAASSFTGVSPSPIVILAGFLGLFFLEFSSVLFNEIHDRRTDQRNRNHGPFTGGSRVLVEDRLRPSHVRRTARITLALAALFLLGVVIGPAPGAGPVVTVTSLALLATGFLLGPGYTAPPFRLVYRGAGEMVVAYTHSVFMTLGGWIFAGGSPFDPLPWLLSLPMALAILAAITLAGIPDADADRAVSKKTLAVRFRPSGAALIALGATILSVLAVWFLPFVYEEISHLYDPLASWITAHAFLQGGLLVQFLRRRAGCRKINALLACALSFILWFSLGPLLVLLTAHP